MSNDFKKILVKDPRLMVTDSLNYAVIKGGQNVVVQPQIAISQSTSSINFNFQVPSEQTIVDRNFTISSKMVVRFQTGTACNLVYGQNFSLAPFPLHQTTTTIQSTINNNVTSINIRDILPAIIRSNDTRELQKMHSGTPCTPDSMYYYNAGLGGTSTASGAVPNLLSGNTLGNFTTSSIDTDYVPNGAFSGIASNQSGSTPVLLEWATSSTYGTLAPATYNSTPATYWQLTFYTYEPVLCQPYLFSNPVSNKQGMYGVQTIQLQYNLTDASRTFRCVSFDANAVAVTFVTAPTIYSVTGSQLLINMLTPHPSDLMPPRNVIPLLTYDRYFSTIQSATIPPNYATPVTVSSNTYNLTQIPDKICIFLRKSINAQRPTDADVSPVISGISLNFNNNSGILASSTIHDLWKFSVDAGSNQSFNEYCGQAYAYDTTAGAVIKPTVGSYLWLDFGKHIQLVEDFYSPGSLGNFQLQFNVQLQNQSANALTAGTYELVLLVMSSGLMVSERGQTSTYSGILTKSDVLDASQQQPLSITSVERIVGSGSLDKGRALPKHLSNMLLPHHGSINPIVSKVMEVKDAMSKRLM